MADFTAYRVGLLGQDYPTKYDNFVLALQGYATEVENGRQGQASLAANFGRYILASQGLTVSLNANGLRIENLGAPNVGTDAVNKAYADNLSFSSALPSQAGNAGLGPRTDGVTTVWDNWWGAPVALTSATTLTNRTAYHLDSSGGAFSANLPPATAKGWVLIRDVSRLAASKPLTLVPNGTDKVYGATQNYLMDKNGETLMLVVDATKGWVRA